MKAIAKLKDDARRHEQKEEWEKAINAYLQVLRLADQGDDIELDLPLYNRVGDLYVRLGLERDAVKYYEQAADRYAEAGLYNNAIALCNKALRYDEGRLELLKKLGSFSASQGFFTDARRWYLEYAERSVKFGAVDEAFSALTDLAHVSDDPEIRELLAGQMRDHGRTKQAVDQYKQAYAMRIAAGQESEANAIRAMIEKLDPDVDMSVAATPPFPGYQPVGRHKEEELPGFVDHAPPPLAAAPVTLEPEPEILEPQPPELTSEPEIVTEAAGFDDIELEVFGETEPAEAEVIDTFDLGTEMPLHAGPMEVEEEHELFDLSTFGGLGGLADDGEELPLLSEEQELDLLQDMEPLPGLDMIETAETLRGSEEGLSALDIGEIDREETDFDAEPLPMLDVGMQDDESPALDMGFQPDSELEYWTQPRFTPPVPEADIEAEPEFEVEDEAAFEFAPAPEPEAETDAEPESESVPETEPGLEWEVETVPRFEAEHQFEFADDTNLELGPESEIEIHDELDAAFETESEPAFETESMFEAEPFVEAEPYVEAEPDVVAEPFVEAEPYVEAEPDAVAEPFVEAEPYVEAEPDAVAGPFVEAEPVVDAKPHLEVGRGEVWAEFDVEPQPEQEPEFGSPEETEPWTWEDVEPEADAEADLEVPGELEPERRVEFEPAAPLMIEPQSPVAFEAASAAEPTEAEQAPVPPAGKADSQYIDLAAFLGEDDEKATDSTRFVVAERPPTGDEEKDFADMLQQFKQKVAETIPREDAGSHYDLGLAFKEMGLIDEAIGEFQTALRSGQEKLKVYEELGSCFVIKQQYSIAITVLTRAQQMPFDDESDLLGVYYSLGRAHEELGQRLEAKSAYEKIIAIDIGFQDTSARLARL